MSAEVSSPLVDYGPTAHTNPNIFQLEIKQKHVLCHEIGAGSQCTKCPDCPGLDLHFWRKRCKACGCRMDDHDVILPNEYDHAQLVVGRLFGVEMLDSVVSSAYELSKSEQDKAAKEGQLSNALPLRQTPRNTLEDTNKRRTMPLAQYNVKVNPENGNEKKSVEYAWVPVGEPRLIDKYMKALPEEERPIAGTKGEQNRRHKLAYQLPLYDCNVEDSRFASDQDKVVLGKFVENVKKNVIGVGNIVEVETPEVIAERTKLRAETKDSNTQTETLEEMADKVGRLNLRDGSLPRKKKAQKGSEVVQEIEPVPCKTCTQMIKVGEVGIRTDHGSKEDTWHPGCFKCSQCDQLLVDMLYFYHDGKYYCGRHFADQQYPRCAGCDELIFANEYTWAEEKSFHFDHFACFKCDFKLGGHRYMTKNDQPYCIDCYMEHFAKTCDSCKKKIGPDEKRLNYNDIHWHAQNQCFCCAECSENLVGKKFIWKEHVLYCSSKCKQEYLEKKASS